MIFDLDAIIRNIIDNLNVTPGTVTGTVIGVLLIAIVFGNSFFGESFTIPVLLTLVFSAAAVLTTHFLLSNTSVTWVFEEYLPAKAAYPALTAVVILAIAIIPFRIADARDARRELEVASASKS